MFVQFRCSQEILTPNVTIIGDLCRCNRLLHLTTHQTVNKNYQCMDVKLYLTWGVFCFGSQPLKRVTLDWGHSFVFNLARMIISFLKCVVSIEFKSINKHASSSISGDLLRKLLYSYDYDWSWWRYYGTVMNSGLYSVCGIEEICSWKDINNEWGP